MLPCVAVVANEVRVVVEKRGGFSSGFDDALRVDDDVENAGVRFPRLGLHDVGNGLIQRGQAVVAGIKLVLQQGEKFLFVVFLDEMLDLVFGNQQVLSFIVVECILYGGVVVEMLAGFPHEHADFCRIVVYAQVVEVVGQVGPRIGRSVLL